MTVADLVIERLRDAGVHALFGVPGGGSNLDLIAAASRAGVRFVLTSTETAGALAAIAQAEITGGPGACLTTLGPGAAAVVNGVACAFLDRAPLVIFTDNHPVSARAFEHQRLDHASLFASITKRSATITADSAGDAIDRAIALALTAPSGPVHLDCPGEVAGASVPETRSGCVFENFAKDPALQERASVFDDSTIQTIRRARKPLLLVGLGARRREDAIAIRHFCERRSLPAMVTYKAKGVVPDDHRWFAGVFTNGTIERPLIEQSDLLIGVGLDPVELIPRPWRSQQPVLHVGRWKVEEGHVPFASQVLTEIPVGLERLESELRSTQWDPDCVRDALSEQLRQIRVPDHRLNAQRVVDIASARLASISRVTVDAGAHMFPATMLWPACEPNQMLISNGLSTMGFALPAAIGAALLDSERLVVALTGDGGLLMCVGELLTAVREQLRIMTIVLSDGSLSLIDIKQQARALERVGVELGAISWPTLAGSFGVRAFCAETEDQLKSCIESALECSGPTLVEARIDPGNYGATLRAVRG
jgi:acetolactate synthase I/II/III large subunit